MGAQILTYPSAFTVATGLAHWESLLRSRAIENQCYVVAAAQTGIHNSKRSSYGHAMVNMCFKGILSLTVVIYPRGVQHRRLCMGLLTILSRCKRLFRNSVLII